MQLTKSISTAFNVYPYPSRFPVTTNTIIAPFWADINTLNSGEVFYREIKDFNTLNSIGCDIGQMMQTFSNFKPSWSYIITWFEVGAHGFAGSNNLNTFQLVLATDSSYSFLLFNYENLSWPNVFVDKSVEIGYNDGFNKNNFHLFKDSFTVDITSVRNKSNVNVPGKWLFRVDEKGLFKFFYDLANLFTFNFRLTKYRRRNWKKPY